MGMESKIDQLKNEVSWMLNACMGWLSSSAKMVDEKLIRWLRGEAAPISHSNSARVDASGEL
jgi:hypothetical protein